MNYKFNFDKEEIIYLPVKTEYEQHLSMEFIKFIVENKNEYHGFSVDLTFQDEIELTLSHFLTDSGYDTLRKALEEIVYEPLRHYKTHPIRCYRCKHSILKSIEYSDDIVGTWECSRNGEEHFWLDSCGFGCRITDEELAMREAQIFDKIKGGTDDE